MRQAGRAATLVGALLASLVSLAGTGCARTSTALTEEQLLSQGTMVQEAKPGAAAAARLEALTPAEADAAADLADDLLARGDPAGALETARAALARMPPQEEADRLREIRGRAKKALLRTAIARAEASAPAAASEGEPIPIRVVLRNLSPVPLEATAPSSGISPTTVLLRITREARDIFGNVRSESWEETHPLPTGAAPPGGVLEASIPLDTARFSSARPNGFVVYGVEGAVLPSGLRVGESAIHERIPFDGTVTLAFPQRGWEEVAADPTGHLDRGLRDENPVRVLLAAGCLPAEARAETGVRLAGLLRGGTLRPAVESSVRASLRWLGSDPGADAWTGAAWEARAAAGRPAARFTEEPK